MTSRLPKNITFVLTDECNFRCKYCYIVHKSPRRQMPFAVARAAIDYILTHREVFPEESAVWDFIGGEPLLEVELIERIIDYVRLRSYELDHPWCFRSMFNITTNGWLYDAPATQRMIRAHQPVLSITMTIDGPAHVHDSQRVTVDGKGTYARVAAQVPLWLSQFPQASTKVTTSHENLPFLAESILHLFDLDIRSINANCVFEPVWQPGDDALLERELDRLGEAMIARDLWRTHQCSFLSRVIGKPMSLSDQENWCGSGKMLAIDCDGNFYPCNRFLAASLSKRPARMVGNIHDGLDLNRVRPFLALTRSAQSSDECIQCQVASGCAWCQGFNYDEAPIPTIYRRATYICEMHKARARSNRRFWERVDRLT